jgi:hypothetical protein
VSARRLTRVLMWIVLVASGAYVGVYLYRWEWNRALIAGIFFLAAELAIGIDLVLARLRRLEAGAVGEGDGHAALQRVREAAPEPHRHFAWLEDGNGSMSVFVPLLLGAGVLLSVVATVVERLARVTGTPVLERRLADRLAPLSLPAGGLLGPEPDPPGPPPAHQRLRHLAGRGVGTTLAGSAAPGSVAVLAGATKDGSDPLTSGSSSLVVLTVEHRFVHRDPARTLEALFTACRHTINGRSELREVTTLDDGRLAAVVEPALGRHARNRFEGCIEDAVFDRVSAAVHVVVDRAPEAALPSDPP